MLSLPFFIIAVASILISPGPTNAMLSTSGALVGLKRSLPLIVMEVAGYLLTIFLMLAFVRPVIDAWEHFGQALRVILSAYLIILAYRLWYTRTTTPELAGRIVTSHRVFVTTLLNPKGLIFAFVLFPPFDGMVQFGTYAAVFVLTVVPISIAWIAFGASIGHYLTAEAKVLLPRIAATALIVFACAIFASAFLASGTARNLVPLFDGRAVR
jgi:threonine/homoserine/homoserine lactone efflux protein